MIIIKYDILIVGSGPCGLTAALELSQKHSVCIVEIGHEYPKRDCPLDKISICKENCNPCNVISGFGGCQFHDGTKLTFFPAGSGLTKFINKNNIKNYYEYIRTLLVKFGLPQEKIKKNKDADNIQKKFQDIGMDVKYYNSQKVNYLTMTSIGNNINKELIKNNVKFYYNSTIKNIKKEKDFEIELSSNIKIYAKKIVFATGRNGVSFLENISKELSIKHNNNDDYISEIGVRIEMPSEILKNISKSFNDIKIRKIIDENNEVRTFCQNYQGIVKKCVFDRNNEKYISLDGCIMEDNYNNSANIAIHHRIKNIPLHNKNKECLKINKPIVQDMNSFFNNNNDFKINEKYCTMKDYKIDNINNYLSLDTLNYIKQMIIDINKVIPGFADKNNLVYAPSFELGFKKYKLSQNFETNIKGIYIGGDATGYFRGIMQAMISGKVISEDIERKLENE